MKQRWSALLGLALLASVIVLSVAYFSPTSAPQQRSAMVTQRSFTLYVHERGQVRPARVVPIKSAISSNQAKLVWLYEEGQPVNQGLVVARFDSKPFMDNLQRAEQDFVDAEARLKVAQQALQVQQEQSSGKLEAAQRNLDIAHLKADDLTNGSGRLQRRRLEQGVQQAQRSYDIADSELADFEVLLQKGHVSRRERDKVADRLRTAAEALNLAQAELTNFERFEWPRMQHEAAVIVDTAQTELARVQRVNELELQQYHDKVVKFARDLDAAEDHLDNAQKDVRYCDVSAPIDGVLLYKALPSRDGQRKIQIGDSVWVGQTFMEIPDTREMVVEFSVREIDVAKLRPGLSASVELDAFPGQMLSGTVLSVSSLPEEDQQSAHMRRFKVSVELAQSLPDMHVGMSAAVNIRYRDVTDALSVPVNALRYQDGNAVVLLTDGEQQRSQIVEVGDIGTEWAAINSGLTAGQRVVVE